MIKHKTISVFMLQLSFDVFLQDFFNVNISLSFPQIRINSTQLGHIFKESVLHMLYQFIEAFLAWIYYFFINVNMFSCHISLLRPVMINSLGSIFSALRSVSCAWMQSFNHPSQKLQNFFRNSFQNWPQKPFFCFLFKISASFNWTLNGLRGLLIPSLALTRLLVIYPTTTEHLLELSAWMSHGC